MYFVTNRGMKQSRRSRAGRKVDFDLGNTEAQQSVYFCRRDAPGDYVELTSKPFLQGLKETTSEQVVILIHGFSSLPEENVFPSAETLQALFDEGRPGRVQVVPLIWPCDNDLGIIQDYWDDQKAADASAFAFSRVLEKFMGWRDLPENVAAPCLKRINILAHSMGNRVLRETLRVWAKYDRPGGLPLLFRNTFLVAADIVNESLERGNTGERICECSRNVAVYFASDDLALRASKVANLKNFVASRRLGHTGPEDMSKVPNNVYAIDCDNFNMRYDPEVGHRYFLRNEQGAAGTVFLQIRETIETGRVPVGPDHKERELILE